MKKLKLFAGILGCTMLLLAIAISLLVTLVDPNKYTPQLIAYVKQHIGKEIIIDGKVHWSFYPKLGISVDNVELKDGIDGQVDTFAKAKSLTVYAKFLPLLVGNVEVDTLQADQLLLNLSTDNKGRNNWQPTEQQTESRLDAQASSPTVNLAQFDLNMGKLKITHGTIHFSNRATGKKLTFTDVNLNSKHIGANRQFPLNAKFTLKNAGKSTNVYLNTTVYFDDDAQTLTLNDVDLNASPSGETPLHLQTPKFQLNFKQQRLTIPELHLSYASVKAKGSVIANDLFSDAKWIGSISTNQFNLKKLAANIGHPLKMRHKTALTQVQLNGKINVTADEIGITNLNGRVDNKAVTGSLAYQFSPAAIRVSLYTDTLDLDQYLTQKKHNAKPTATAKQASTSQPSETSDDDLMITGDLGVGQLHFKKLNLSQVKTNFNYQNRVFTAKNMQANMYSGRANGELTVNLSRPSTQYQLQAKLRQINMQQGLSQLFNSNKVLGTGHVDINVRTRGTNKNQLLTNLSGSTNIRVDNGRVLGLDLVHKISAASFDIQKLVFKGTPDQGFTLFKTLIYNAKFYNGVMHNTKLDVRSPNIRIDGNGRVNLLNRSIRYKIGAYVAKTTDIKTPLLSVHLDGIRIPVTVTGTVKQPKVSVDMSTLAGQVVTNQLKNTLVDTVKTPLHIGNKVKDTVRKLLPF